MGQRVRLEARFVRRQRVRCVGRHARCQCVAPRLRLQLAPRCARAREQPLDGLHRQRRVCRPEPRRTEPSGRLAPARLERQCLREPIRGDSQRVRRAHLRAGAFGCRGPRAGVASAARLALGEGAAARRERHQLRVDLRARRLRPADHSARPRRAAAARVAAQK